MQLSVVRPFWELQNYKTIQLALLILWLTLTGGYRGWDVPQLVIINGLLFSLLMGWGLTQLAELYMHPLAFPLVMLGAANLASTWFNFAPNGAVMGLQWLGYGVALLCFKRWQLQDIQLVARWLCPFHLALAYTPLIPVIGGWWNNMNVIAALIVSLYLLSIGDKPLELKSYDGLWLVFVFITIGYWLESIGGLMALILGLAILLLKQFDLALIPVAWVGLGSAYVISPVSFHWRLNFWAEAVRLFSLRPYLGIGANQFKVISGPDTYLHAHNVAFTTLAETGLIGAVPLVMFLVRVIRGWSNLPHASRAVVYPLLVWSMIDEPLRFWGVGALFIFALCQYEER